MISDEEIRDLERLEREATAGPWEFTSFLVGGGHGWPPSGRESVIVGPGGRWDRPLLRDKDNNFIAAARNALPKLIAAYRLQERVCEAARHLADSKKFADEDVHYSGKQWAELLASLAAIEAARGVK